MKRRLLSILLALTMVLTMLPVSAMAYLLPTDKNAGDNNSWTWDYQTKTLTFTNFKWTDCTDNPAVELPADSTIVLNGENEITTTGIEGIYCEGNLTIQGNGSLSITAAGSSTNRNAMSYGIFADGAIEITDAEVTATGGNVSIGYAADSYGIAADGDVSISNATVNAAGNVAGCFSCGIFSNGHAIKIENSTVTATASNAPGGGEDDCSCGICANLDGTITIKDSSVIAKSTSTESAANAIHGEFTVDYTSGSFNFKSTESGEWASADNGTYKNGSEYDNENLGFSYLALQSKTYHYEVNYYLDEGDTAPNKTVTHDSIGNSDEVPYDIYSKDAGPYQYPYVGNETGHPEKENYIFMGWKTLNGDNDSDNNGYSHEISKDATDPKPEEADDSMHSLVALQADKPLNLYAVWQENTPEPPQPTTYTVIYNGNGNTSGTAPIDSNTYTTGSAVTLADAGDLVKEGYTFLGWALSEDATSALSSYTVDANNATDGVITLYAVWQEKPTTAEQNVAVKVRFVRPGTGSDEFTPLTDDEFTALAELANTTFSLEKNKFKWLNVGTISNVELPIVSGNEATADQKATAKEAIQAALNSIALHEDGVNDVISLTSNDAWNVFYDSNGWRIQQTVIVYNVIVENDGNGTASANYTTVTAGTEITLTAEANSGYRFKEWQVTAGGVTVADNKFTMLTSDVTVKAIFELIPVPVDVYVLFTDSTGTRNGFLTKDELKLVKGLGENVTLTPNGSPRNWLTIGTIPHADVENVDAEAAKTNAVNALSTIQRHTNTFSLDGVTINWDKCSLVDGKWHLDGIVKTYTVTYDANGAEEGTVPVDSYLYVDGTPVNALGNTGNLTKSGYVFDGWSLTKSGDAVESVTINSDDITLYAQWAEDTDDDDIGDKYEEAIYLYVHFKDNQTNSFLTDLTDLNAQWKTSLVPNGNKNGWMTIGYVLVGDDQSAKGEIDANRLFRYADNTELDLTKVVWDFDNLVTANGAPGYVPVGTWTKHLNGEITLYTVTYTDGVDGEEVFADQTTKYLLSGAKTPDFNGTTTRTGYVFAGWNHEIAATVSGDATYVATWKDDKNGNGIADEDDKFTVIYTDGVDRIEIFKDEVYTDLKINNATPSFSGRLTPLFFKGWNPEVNPVIDAADDTDGDCKIIYTAQWRRFPIGNTTPVTPDPTVKVKGLNTVDHVAYIVGIGNDMANPLGTITRAEVATIYFRLMTDDFRAKYWSDSCSYADVADTAWYNVAISTLEAAGAIQDTAKGGNFRPNDPITRAELAVMAAQFAAVTGTIPATSFKDVSSTYWAAKEIAIVEYAGWIEGYNGFYRPDDNLTRAECVTIVNRMLQRGAEAENMLKGMVSFVDNVYGTWYYEAVQEAANSHTYSRTSQKLTGENFLGEKWVKIETAPDWAALEKTWADANK